MVRTFRATLLAVLATVVTLSGAAPAAAYDLGGSGSGGTGGGGSGNGSGGGGLGGTGSGSGGSSGDPAQTTVKTCSLFATSGSFGLSCISGDGTGNAKTVKQILGKQPLPTCWDSRIPDDELASKYQYQQNPDAPYYLHTCIAGLNPDSSPSVQPDAQINQVVLEIPTGAKPCYNYDEAKKKATPFTAEQVGTCVMTLTQRQHQVVSGGRDLNTQIPGIIVAPQPSTRIRTNEDVAYQNVATAPGGTATRTPTINAGGVRMWAAMDRYRILPDGPDGPSKTCNGSVSVGPDDSRQSTPNACWWEYTQASTYQPGQTFPFRAEADWTVYYDGGGGPQVLASFQKYDDLTLPVFDVQTVVVR